MYRFLRLGAAIASVVICFAGCGNAKKQMYDMARHSNEGGIKDTAFAEGCYCNEDFVIELICTEESEAGNTYNLIMFSKDDGEQKFFGTVKGDIENGLSVEDVGEDKIITVKAQENASMLTVTCTYNGVSIPSVCGEYEYFEEGWTPKTEEENVYIREGVYRNGEYKLTVYDSGNVLRFVITDADGIVVCEGSQRAVDAVSSVNVEYDGMKIGLAAGLYENKLYIEVAGYGGKADCEYSGKYKIIE